ncbi:MAG: hypothetical protein FJ029_11985, partial [Actinobacteria bacterium]|nr:hypothetical protein [Actinomycetota bacterium]
FLLPTLGGAALLGPACDGFAATAAPTASAAPVATPTVPIAAATRTSGPAAIPAVTALNRSTELQAATTLNEARVDVSAAQLRDEAVNLETLARQCVPVEMRVIPPRYVATLSPTAGRC